MARMTALQSSPRRCDDEYRVHERSFIYTSHKNEARGSFAHFGDNFHETPEVQAPSPRFCRGGSDSRSTCGRFLSVEASLAHAAPSRAKPPPRSSAMNVWQS